MSEMPTCAIPGLSFRPKPRYLLLCRQSLGGKAFSKNHFLIETNHDLARNIGCVIIQKLEGGIMMYTLRGILVPIAISLLGTLALAACAPAPAPTLAPTTAPTAAPATIAPTVAAPTVAATTAPAATATAATAGTSGAVTVKLGQIQGFGLFLTDDAGRTLYEFDNDTKDTSNCTGNCLQNWPPFLVRSVPQAGDRVTASLLSTFTRADGTMQAEYDGHPLYYYSRDKNPGDVLGHGVGNVWHVLSPRGTPMTNPAPTATKAP